MIDKNCRHIGKVAILPEVGYPKQFRIQSTHSRTKSEIDSLVNESYLLIAGGKEDKKMKTTTFVKILLAVFLSVAWSQMAFAEQKSITLPKGTTVQKVGPGHFKFILPDKRIVEVQNFDPKTVTIGLVSIIDPDPPIKPVVSGKQGKLVVTRKLTRAEVGKLPSADYVMVDDDVTWLPATITFQLETKGKQRLKGLSPQPDPPGKK